MNSHWNQSYDISIKNQTSGDRSGVIYNVKNNHTENVT